MAFMHVKTFDIFVCGDFTPPDGFVWIDEPIAPAIQALNRRGYITLGCCGGHLLKDVVLIDSESEDGYKLERHGEIYSRPSVYIIFEEGVSLPSLPPGFYARSRPSWPPGFFEDMAKNGLERTYEEIEPFITGSYLVLKKRIEYEGNHCFIKSLRGITETMEQLYDWALGLPDFKGDEGEETRIRSKGLPDSYRADRVAAK